jgi:transcription elongation factor/antiterminator RfaH
MSLSWYAVYIKPRHEDMVAERLSRAEIEVFNPKLKRVKVIRRRYREVIEPVFPCYIFARFDISSGYRMVKYTRGVKDIVGGGGMPWPVDDRIIKVIESMMNKDGLLVIRPEIHPGDKVEITNGPLKGLVGIFEKEMKGKDRVIVLLNTLQYQARVEIKKEFLGSRTYS